jgi:hypothetical protein
MRTGTHPVTALATGVDYRNADLGDPCGKLGEYQ